jgi:uncharacterized delta-60 repeat protein
MRLPPELLPRPSLVAVVVAAVGLATAPLVTGALGSTEGEAKSAVVALALAVGRHGELTVAGVSTRWGTKSARDFAVVRYTRDGQLDGRFGRGGKVLTAFGPSKRTDAGATSLAIRPDGRIVVAGYAYDQLKAASGFAIAAYTAAGAPDRTFGRNGKALTYVGPRGDASQAHAVAIQPDGKVVVAGNSRYRFALARYTRGGRLDASFGHGGTVVTDFGAAADANAEAVAVQEDGKIVVAGSDFHNSRLDVALARYNRDGTLDHAFGSAGRVVTNVGNGDRSASALVIQSDGKLVVALGALAPHDDFALIRYDASGELDPSFGLEGRAATAAVFPAALAIQRDGKLVTAGGYAGAFALARFLQDGSVDATFGQSGKLRTKFFAPARATGVVVQADGRIVAAGTAGGRDFALARYTSTGRLDGTFGRGGKALTDFGSVWMLSRH